MKAVEVSFGVSGSRAGTGKFALWQLRGANAAEGHVKNCNDAHSADSTVFGLHSTGEGRRSEHLRLALLARSILVLEGVVR